MLTSWSALRAMFAFTVVALLAELSRLLLLAPGGPPGVAVTSLAVAVLVGAIVVGLACAAWLGRIAASIPLGGRAAALREKSWGAAFLRQRDPDAAGRPRPRAPSAALTAA
jgi:Family of unknown function (DUF6412)